MFREERDRSSLSPSRGDLLCLGYQHHLFLRHLSRNQIEQEIGCEDRGGQKVKGIQDSKAVGNQPTNYRRKSGEEGLDTEESAHSGSADIFRGYIHHPGQDHRLQGEEEKTEDRQDLDEKELEPKEDERDQEEAGCKQPCGQHRAPPFPVREGSRERGGEDPCSLDNGHVSSDLTTGKPQVLGQIGKDNKQTVLVAIGNPMP